MNSDIDNTNMTTDTTNDIQFEEVFNLEDIQHLQDLFSETSGVASIITHPDGTPITNPSNFCRLCKDIIRKTEKGRSNCYLSDEMISRFSPSGAIVWPCLSGGLWDAGTSITVGGKHIANWLIGQVRNEAWDEQRMLQYANEIGADREDFMEALKEVPAMSFEQFNNLAKMLFGFAKKLSEKGYNNLQLKQQINERDKAIKLLQENEKKYLNIFENVREVFYQSDLNGNILEISPSIKYFSDFNRDELIGTPVHNLYYNLGDREILLNEIRKNGELRDYELKVKTKTGDIKYVSINARLISDIEGRPNHIVGAIRDITSQKRTETTLLENEIKYRELVDNSPDAIAIYAEGKIVFVNNECIRLLGASGYEELIGKSVMEFVHPNYRALVIERMKKATAEGTVLPLIEEKFIRLDGSELEVEVKAMAIRHENKPAVQLIVRDITERKNAVKALVKLEKAIYTSGEAIFLTDLEGVFTFVNPAFSSLYGFSLDEIIGKATPRIIKSGILDKSVYEYFWKTLLNGDEVRGELINKRKDRTLINIDGSATPIIDEEKNIIGFLGIQRDITERKQVEEKLREQSDAMEAAIDGLAILDPDQNYIYMNKSHAGIYGYDYASELIGASWRVLYDTEELQRFDQEILPELNQKGYYQGMARGKKKDGSVFPQALSLTVLVNGGLICTIRDITELKQAEQELITAKEKAEESDRLKTAFLNNISHEIRTPFNGILGFLSLIQDDDLPGNERDEYIGIINQSADRLMHTINDIVEISQIQAGQMKLTISETNIKRLTDKLSDRFKNDAEFKGLEFIIKNDLPENIAYISTDGIKLKTILSNLISNAIKFTKTGSIVLGIRENDNYLEFSVKDTGIGISENQQQVIFERFIQSDGSRTRQFEGLGLGLSIAKSYIEMLGGKIWIESEEGKGSTFYFTFPR